VQNVPETMVTDLIGGANQNFAARLYPISDNLTTADSHVGTFTAACAVHIYRGDALPAEYRGDAFACDPTANLVHRDQLTPVGPTFASRMSNEGREFLASPDNWFRPVFLAIGPDRALYVCDMYRKTIEHPDYLPVEVRKRTDFVSGRDLGRIWRVTGNKFNAQKTYRNFLPASPRWIWFRPSAIPTRGGARLRKGYSLNGATPKRSRCSQNRSNRLTRLH